MNAFHEGLDAVVQTLAVALGFTNALVLREHRLFFTSELCGTLAIAFIRYVIAGALLPADCTEATVLHAKLKDMYSQEVLRCQIAKRPWIWGAGDRQAAPNVNSDLQLAVNITRDQRIDLIYSNGLAMADDEIRFHVMQLVSKQPFSHLPQHEQPFTALEPLVFNCWDSIGHVIAAQWCQRNPQIRAQGQNIVTAVAFDNHWLPIWMVPAQDLLHVHTYQSTIAFEKIETTCRIIAEKLGFTQVVFHRMPTGMPDHSMCGAQAMTFLAHVIMRVPLPQDARELRTAHTNMRASFVAHLYSIEYTPKPVVWGNGSPRNSGPLPIMPDAEQEEDVTERIRAQRLQMLVAHSYAMGDDEISFHVSHLLDCYQVGPRAVGPNRQFATICPVALDQWMHGHVDALAEWKRTVWAPATPDLQLVFVMLFSQHWVPFWVVQSDQTLQFHSLADFASDDEEVDNMCRALALELGFEDCVTHRVPHGLDVTRLCGTMSINFLAHIMLRTRLPHDSHQLRARCWDMKDLFAEAIQRGDPSLPTLWGWGLFGESRLLPIMPVNGPFEAMQKDMFGLQIVPCSKFRRVIQDLLDDGPGAEVPTFSGMSHHVMQFCMSQLNAISPSTVQFAVATCLADLVQKLVSCKSAFQLNAVAVLHEGHWTPVVVCQHSGKVWVFADGVITTEISCIWPEGMFHKLPACSRFCGASTFMELANVLGLPLKLWQDWEMHCLLHQWFDRNGSPQHDDLPPLWGFGPHGQLTQNLVTELLKHGIPANVVDDRACAAIKALGSEQLIAALAHRNPWKQLKMLGNNSKFQWVMPSELSQAVADNKGKPVGGKSKGKGSKNVPKPLELDPTKLQVLEGVFQSQGHPLNQLSMQQIGPVSSGVILISVHDAEPYLRSGSVVSREPLALLVLNKPGVDVQTALPHAQATIPCKCTLNNEPILVDAVLVQVGTGLVEKSSGNALVSVDTPDVVTLKIMVYKDELKLDWADFAAAPIRCLVSPLPKLKRCFSSDCRCQAWHNAEQLPLRDPILDVWRRQFLRSGFKPCPANQAEIFSVCIRVPQSILDSMLAASGTSGAYVEPRTADGKELLPEYTVVWSTKHTVQELQHLMQTNPAVNGLARLGDRKGLRVHESQAKMIHKLVRPDSVFLPNGPKINFLAGPFPYGADRTAVGKILHKAGWECRPLQPSAPCPGRGSMWLIQAIEDPEHAIISTTNGEIVVTRQKQDASVPNKQQTSVGSAATLALCGTSASVTEADPWSHHDPWRRYQPAQSCQTATGPSEGMMQIEERVQNAVLAKMQPPMEHDLPDRVHALEDQVHQLLSKQHGLENQCHEFSGQHSQEIHALQTQVTAQAQQLHGHLENQNQTMQSLFEQQMQQIRGLLSKRPREEGLEWQMGRGFVACLMALLVSLFWGWLVVRTLGLALMFTLGLAFCHKLSYGCSSRTWYHLLALSVLLRIGEATNPGPDQSSFILGAFNPSGLKGKAPFIVSQLAHGDIWAITETHLCSQSLVNFRSSLHFAKSRYRHFVGGHPVPAQQNRVFHAAWRGVGVLSMHPTREVPTNIPESILASSRLLITTTLLHDCWITGGTVYGEPESSSYPQAKQNNETLLHHAAGHVCHLAKGPRFLAGDWNILADSTPAFDVLHAAGFRDLQDLARDRWGRPISNTCKNATRKDFCFVSRELQHLLQEVVVQQDVFPDHAVIWGEFLSPSQMLPRQVWATPAEFPWPAHWTVDPDCWVKMQGTCDEKYHLLWQHIEHCACQALPFKASPKTLGRAATTDVKLVLDGKVSPPKKGRPQDVQPQYVCATFRHAQWLRQLRRLQAYIRHVTARDHCTEHAFKLWGAILRAPGFSSGFAGWWSQCEHRTHGSPDVMPVIPPALSLAVPVFESFALAFREFEKDLQQASRQYARHRREQNPNAIFHDIRSCHARGVDALIQPVTATVVEVRSDEGMVVLDRPAPFDSSQHVCFSGEALPVVHADSDAIWIDAPDRIQVGAKVSQLHFKGTDDELFQLFLDAWKQMWGRHQQVPSSRWNDILQFARVHLPYQHMTWPAMDVRGLRDCIAHKNKATSAGLDGVTLRDLCALPDSALSNFVAMFAQSEQTGEWPQQVIAGRVTCLPKKEQPADALDFRPITVLGLLYRCWGTFHARHAIRALESILPLGLFGSRPQCYAGQVWSQLLWTIELAYEQGTPLWWAGALASMPRRFQINGSLSAPAFSSCGLPEGCALSCVGMMVVDILFHKWMTHFFPLCQPLSYVDDWQVLVTDPQRLQPVYTCLESFTQAMDLFVDKKKTHMWSVSAEGRQLIRAQGMPMVSFERNLGAHVQFSRQHTNCHLLKRVASAGPLWQKLKLSACAYSQKIRALKSAAWPKCLHAVAATTVSHATFKGLRAGAMKGLRADGSGANSMVHLGLIEHATTDPQVWSILQTCRLVRDCGSPDRVENVLAALVTDQSSLPVNSITNTLLVRIQVLGWSVNDKGWLVDMLGPFSLFSISAAELQYRVELQWTLVVADATKHRPCFQGLGAVDPADTRKWLMSLNTPDRALFRKLLNGTHITQDGKHYCQEVEHDLCLFCECSDCRFHRFWICTRFSAMRCKVPREVLQVVAELPEAVTSSGWSLMPSTMHDWNQYFVQIPDAVLSPGAFSGVVHLFTDGSCHGQHDEKIRFAGWAAVQANIEAVHDCDGSRILAAGVLPGLLQSAVRAEIYAILKALQLVVDHPGIVMLWSDCDAVVRRVRKLLEGQKVKVNASHSDLWNEIQHCLALRAGETQITRVAAHQTEQKNGTVFSEWCFRHNELADKQAVRANLSRPAVFWQLFHTHAQAVDSVRWFNREIQAFLLAVSREVVQMDQPAFVQTAMEPEDLGMPCPDWHSLPTLSIPSLAVRWYGDRLVRLILSWFWQGVDAVDSPPCWILHFQLYIDYMCSTGHPGPIHLTRWCDGEELSHLQLRGLAFRQRSRWFVKVLKQSLKHLGVVLAANYGRPKSHMVQMFTGCLAIPWPQSRLDLIDQWMYSHAESTFKRQTKAIDSLPFAARTEAFPPTFVSSVCSWDTQDG